jgi:hypothetical protein
MRRKHGAILHHVGLFEMRRLEALSNTIFGVAMALLAYDLPKASGFAKAPSWIDLVALMISFIVAGLFWFSHHRRLAVAPEGTRPEVFLNLLFLASIIILPVTNGLYGSYRLDSVVAVIYGVHLIVIGALNALLWFLALRSRDNPELLATAMFPPLGIPGRHRHGLRRPLGGAVHMVPGICSTLRRPARRARPAPEKELTRLRKFVH